MGCKSSRSAAADEPQPAAASELTKGTIDGSSLPSADAKALPSSDEGSDTSTKDTLEASGEERPSSNDITEEEPPRELALLDSVLQAEAAALGIPIAEEGEDGFLEVPDGVDFDLERKAPVLKRQASCLMGTTPRESNRRVSFTENSPDVLEIAPIERDQGNLRRANAVSAAEMPFEMDVDDMDPQMQAMLQMQQSAEEDRYCDNDEDDDDDVDDEVSPPWGAGLSAMGVYEPPEATLTSHQPQPQCLTTKFGWCCVTRGDDSLPMHGELEYDIWEQGDETFLPYASQVHGYAARSMPMPNQSPTFSGARVCV